MIERHLAERVRAGDEPQQPQALAGQLLRIPCGQSGDAMTFISVLRLVALWLPPRRNPVFVQLTGVLGQLGSVGVVQVLRYGARAGRPAVSRPAVSRPAR